MREHHSDENHDSFPAQRSTCSLLSCVAGKVWQLDGAPRSRFSPACPGESISRCSSRPGGAAHVHPGPLRALCDSTGHLARCRAHFQSGSYCGPVFLGRGGNHVCEHFERRRSFESHWSCGSEMISHKQSSNRVSCVVLRNAERPVHQLGVSQILFFFFFFLAIVSQFSATTKQHPSREKPTSLLSGTANSHFSLSTPPDEVRASVEYAVATPAIPRVSGVVVSGERIRPVQLEPASMKQAAN